MITPDFFRAAGMTLVMLCGEIDISVGSAFAVCAVAAGDDVESRRADPRADRDVGEQRVQRVADRASL